MDQCRGPSATSSRETWRRSRTCRPRDVRAAREEGSSMEEGSPHAKIHFVPARYPSPSEERTTMSAYGYRFTAQFLEAMVSVCDLTPNAMARRVQEAFKKIATRVDATVTLEIGAFEASFSRWARQHLPDARVLAFEANPFVHEHFRDEVTGAGVDYINACICPKAGPVVLNVPRDFRSYQFEKVNQMASLSMNADTEVQEQIEVPGLALDDAVELGPDDRVVAWIDVEGALEQVLAGSLHTLSRASAAYVEVESRPIWHGQWLDVDVVAWFAGIGMVPVLRDLQRSDQYNVLFLAEELAADPAIAKLVARAYALPRARVLQEVPAVSTSLLGRAETLVRPSLRQENERLRQQNRRLRQRIRRLERHMWTLDLKP